MPLMIDIDDISVFGPGGTPSSKLRARKLKLNDPCIIEKYKKLLDTFYVKHKLYEKISAMNRIPVQYSLQNNMVENTRK